MQVTVRQQNSGATPLLTSIEELARTKPPWWQYPTRIGEDQGGMLTDGKVVPGKGIDVFLADLNECAVSTSFPVASCARGRIQYGRESGRTN